MKIVNGKIVPDYHPQIIVNTRAFLDRVSVSGTAEARELSKCADLLEAMISGLYNVTDGENAIGTSDGPGLAASASDSAGGRGARGPRVPPPKTISGVDSPS